MHILLKNYPEFSPFSYSRGFSLYFYQQLSADNQSSICPLTKYWLSGK